MYLGRALALCGVKVGDLVWYSQVWLHERERHPHLELHVSLNSLLCRGPARIPKDSCGRGDVCGQWDGIVFLRIMGESFLLSSDIFLCN